MLTRATLTADWLIGEGTVRTFTGLVTGDVDGDDRRHARLGSRRPQQTVVNLADRSDLAVKRAVK